MNLGILLFLLIQIQPVKANSDVRRFSVAAPSKSSMRKGQVRAEIKVLPAKPTLKMPDGTVGFPESVELFLSSSQGDRHVKLGAMEDGSALVLGGESGWVQILSRRDSPFVKLHNKDDREQLIKP